MIIEIHAEKEGLRLSGSIATLSTETHSALSEIPEHIREAIRQQIQIQLHRLLNEALIYRKRL
jgi:hypothetical protein